MAKLDAGSQTFTMTVVSGNVSVSGVTSALVIMRKFREVFRLLIMKELRQHILIYRQKRT